MTEKYKMFLNIRAISIILICEIVLAEDNIVKKIAELEKEKKELYNQINAAIEESVKTLKKSNDTESLTGLKYMVELKKHMRELNQTDIDTNVSMAIDTKSGLGNRRKLDFKHLISLTKKKPKISQDPFDFESILKPKKTSGAELKAILENRIKMQKKLDNWIKERQKEKDRLGEYKKHKKILIMSGKYEKCPRFGYSGSNKKSNVNPKDQINSCRDKVRSPDESMKECLIRVKTKAKKLNSKRKFPCCRKCCKKSYMGCL